MGFRKKFSTATIALAVAALSWASTAPASSHNPTGEFKPFGECPLSNPEITQCVYTTINGDSFTLGKKTVSIANPITFQGGYLGEGEEIQFHGAENGETLSATAQPVPGGLLGVVAPKTWPQGLQDGFNDTINEGFTGVTATIELAEPATSIELSPENMLIQVGTGLGLPVKIKLGDNPILGTNCYIGSNSKPIQLNLTTATSGALAGDPGTLSFNGSFTLVTFTGLELVDGTFAAPEAKGCGGIAYEYVDPLINSIFGLPAGVGKNSITLEGVLEVANDAPVRAP